MTAAEYNRRRIAAGELTVELITEFVRQYQSKRGLDADGKCGPATTAAIRAEMSPRVYPLAPLDDGREPRVTSAFRTADRPRHDGVDLFYERWADDPPMRIGDGGRTSSGRWWIPPGTLARATERGVVRDAGLIGTGYRVRIWHEDSGVMTGYYHLRDCLVAVGQVVEARDALGEVGDNPHDYDAVHLHFETAHGDRAYSRADLFDPAEYLRHADKD